MTISSTARLAGPYTGNGVSTAFAFSFKVFAQADVDVVFANSAGVETTLVLDSDYSITLNGDQDNFPGGTVTYPISGSPMASPNKIAIIGGTDYTQTAALPTGGAYNATVVERALDRLAIMAQQLVLTASRTIRLPFTSDVSVSSTLPSPTALGLIGWNAAANALINYAGVAGVAVSSFMTTVVAAANGVAARTALGFSAIGEALAVAATTAAARTAIAAAGSGLATASGLTQTTARVLGRTTAATGAIEELTGDQVVGLISTPVPQAKGGTGAVATRQVAQIAVATLSAVATGTTITPADDTIPQITEGDQYLSLSGFTPVNANSTLEIEVVLYASASLGQHIAAALYKDGGANAIAVGWLTNATNTYGGPLIVRHTLVPGSTAAITFTVRAGPGTAATVTVNGSAAGRFYGGALVSRITVKEILP